MHRIRLLRLARGLAFLFFGSSTRVATRSGESRVEYSDADRL